MTSRPKHQALSVQLELIPLKDVEDDREFWPGVVFRHYGTGSQNITPENDYYDYMLVRLAWESEHLIVVNISHGMHDAGHSHGMVPMNKPRVQATVLCSSVKEQPGVNEWYGVKGW